MSDTINVSMTGDTYINSANVTTNYSTGTEIYIGEANIAVSTSRAWINPNLSSVPVGVTFLSATLKLTPTTDYSSNARTMSAYRCLRDTVVDQATWNIWKTSNNWGTAGCSNSSTDYDGAIELGNMSVPASPTLNVQMSMNFSSAGVEELQKMYNGTYVNNGIILFVDTQANDGIGYASLEHATSAYRPIITITYQASNFFFMFNN